MHLHFMRILAVIGLYMSGACVSDPFTAKDLSPELIHADVVLIGEIHDNPQHHQIQAAIIKQLANRQRLGAVYFEQLMTSQQGLLDSLGPKDLELLDAKLQWTQRGWPSFVMYRPVFAAAWDAGVPLFASQLNPAQSKSVMSEGLTAVFSQDEQELLGLKQALPDPAQKALERVIDEGHCQMLDAKHRATMIPIQRSWDASMARTWQQHRPAQGIAVFIVGSGHARKDFGIPWYLKRIDPTVKVWSIGLQEEGDARRDQLVPELYDQTFITGRAEREDPCESFRRQRNAASKPSR